MPAFMKLGDFKGEATDTDHKDWVIIESMSSPVFRSIHREQGPAAYEGRDDPGRHCHDTTAGQEQHEASGSLCERHVLQGSGSSLLYDGEEQAGAVSDIQAERRDHQQLQYLCEFLSSPLPSEQITMGYTKAEGPTSWLTGRRVTRRVRYRRSTIRRKAVRNAVLIRLCPFLTAGRNSLQLQDAAVSREDQAWAGTREVQRLRIFCEREWEWKSWTNLYSRIVRSVSIRFWDRTCWR